MHVFISNYANQMFCHLILCYDLLMFMYMLFTRVCNQVQLGAKLWLFTYLRWAWLPQPLAGKFLWHRRSRSYWEQLQHALLGFPQWCFPQQQWICATVHRWTPCCFRKNCVFRQSDITIELVETLTVSVSVSVSACVRDFPLQLLKILSKTVHFK